MSALGIIGLVAFFVVWACCVAVVVWAEREDRS